MFILGGNLFILELKLFVSFNKLAQFALIKLSSFVS